jgi:inosine-uridine nucleoside N-ribohydrolase
MPIPVIIDTDPGMDDALAILLALRSPELDVKALTVASGNVDSTQGTINARKVLQAAGRCDLPVATSPVEPLLRPLGRGWPGHGPDGLGGFSDLPMCSTPPQRLNAVRYLIERLLGAPEPITLVTQGPLTNIALALAAEPEIKLHIDHIVSMGGAVFCPGNTTPTAEFNIWIDPEAAKMVFAAGVPLTLVGLDVTMQTILREPQVQRMAAAEDEVSALAARIGSYVMPFGVARYGEPRMHLHDPLAVGVAIDPSFVRTQKMYVAVETANGITRGQTVGDPRNLWQHAPNVDVCVDVDAGRFVEFFVRRMRNDNGR